MQQVKQAVCDKIVQDNRVIIPAAAGHDGPPALINVKPLPFMLRNFGSSRNIDGRDRSPSLHEIAQALHSFPKHWVRSISDPAPPFRLRSFGQALWQVSDISLPSVLEGNDCIRHFDNIPRSVEDVHCRSVPCAGQPRFRRADRRGYVRRRDGVAQAGAPPRGMRDRPMTDRQAKCRIARTMARE